MPSDTNSRKIFLLLSLFSAKNTIPKQHELPIQKRKEKSVALPLSALIVSIETKKFYPPAHPVS
jgi:hypothetical protein